MFPVNNNNNLFGQNPFGQPQNNQPSLKIKYNNKVKKIGKVPDSLEKFDKIVRKKYQEFKGGKDTYQLTYLDEENEQIDISDDEDYEVFLDSTKNRFGMAVKLFLNKREGGHKFDKEIDDCQTVHESVLGDTLLQSSTERNLMVPPLGFDFNKIDDYKREIEKLKAEKEKALLQNELLKLKQQLEESKEGPKKSKSQIKKEKKSAKKTKKAAKKAKKTKTSKKFKEDVTKDASEEVEINADLKEPEVQASVEMIPDGSSSDSSSKEVLTEVKVVQKESIFEDHVSQDEAPPLKEEPTCPAKIVEASPKAMEPPLKKQKFDFDSDDELPVKEPVMVKREDSCEVIVPVVDFQSSVVPPSERPESFTDDRHQFAIQPVLKEKDQDLCQECKRSLDSDTKLTCSICDNYNLCEACEIRTSHDHVFIKIPKGVEFNLEVYDKFCQKMLGLHTEPPTESKFQMAIMNPQVEKENIKINSMMRKRAQILNKDKYQEGIPANHGEQVSLEWEVKNMTNQPWSKDMIIAVSNTSDLMMNEQRVDLQLGSNEKGTVEVNFVMPKDTKGIKELNLYMYLFDLEIQKPIGEFFNAKLIAYK